MDCILRDAAVSQDWVDDMLTRKSAHASPYGYVDGRDHGWPKFARALCVAPRVGWRDAHTARRHTCAGACRVVLAAWRRTGHSNHTSVLGSTQRLHHEPHSGQMQDRRSCPCFCNFEATAALGRVLGSVPRQLEWDPYSVEGGGGRAGLESRSPLQRRVQFAFWPIQEWCVESAIASMLDDLLAAPGSRRP